MTGIEIRETVDGIWDGGEWLSWTYINPLIQEQLEKPASAARREDLRFEPSVDISLLLIEAILQGLKSTLWGPLGERYAAERLGLKLSRSHAQGHDGRLGNHLVEVKTITREKRNAAVRVTTRGNFSVLVVVRVTDEFELMIRSISRSELIATPGAEYFWVGWDDLQAPSVDSRPTPNGQPVVRATGRAERRRKMAGTLGPGV